jgi:DNA-binding GntR family transcriptional regulator
MARMRTTKSNHSNFNVLGHPIYSIDRISRLRDSLRSNPRDLLLFDFLTETGAKLKDILQLKVKDIVGLTVGDRIPVSSAGIKYATVPVFTRRSCDTLEWYLNITHSDLEDYLFRSRKGTSPISLTSASHLIQKWIRDAGITGHSGSKSLRNSLERPIQPQALTASVSYDGDQATKFLKPIESATLQESVYQQLFQAIVSGRIPPGERLMIGEIANQLQVSPMPVREALHRLQATGFLSPLKKRGNVVNQLSTENIKELTQIRLILEPMAAEQAALLRREETLLRLNDLHEEYIDAIKLRDSDRFLQINKEFHHTIYRESGMPILFQVIELLWARASPYIYILMRESVPTDLEWSIDTHSGIIDAMRQRDSRLMADFIRTDLSKAAQALFGMLEQLWGEKR